jgi:hypothetical protein
MLPPEYGMNLARLFVADGSIGRGSNISLNQGANMTTKTDNQGIYDLTVPVRMCFPNLHEPKPFKENGKDKGEPKYGAVFLLPADHPDLGPLKQKAKAVALAAWPGADLKSITWPFKSGTDYATKRKEAGKSGGEHFEGKVYLPARSKYEPRLSSVENGKLTDLEGAARAASKPKFYPGVEVLAEFNFVANEVNRNRSVTAYLNMVLTLNKGERMGGGRSAAETFRGYAGHTTTEDPTAGTLADDDIPF